MNNNLETQINNIKQQIVDSNSNDVSKWPVSKISRGIFSFVEEKIGKKMYDPYNKSQNRFIEHLLSIHIQKDSQFLYDWVKIAYKITKENKNFFVGDMDVCIDLVFENKRRKVLHVRNTCSCANVVNWIVVWENHKGTEEIHVRGFYPNNESDYPKSNYPQKLSLKFYRDRDFQIKYIEKYHMTNKGSVYGDMRDKGYIISLKKYSNSEINKLFGDMDASDMPNLFYGYNDYVHFMYNARMLHQGFLEKLEENTSEDKID